MRVLRLFACAVFGCAAYRVALDVDLAATLEEHGDMEEANAWPGANAWPVVDHIGEFAKKNELVAAGLEQSQELTEVGEKQKAFAAAVKNAYDASHEAVGAAVDFGSKLTSIQADVDEHQLGPAFDGQITLEDFQVLFGKVDTFLDVVEQILSTTSDLQTVSGLLETLVSLTSKVLDSSTDAATLDAMRSFEARATELKTRCESEVVKLTSVKSDLEPALKQWDNATTWTKGVILVENKVQLERGFGNLSAVFASVQELQPSLQALSGEVSEEVLSLCTGCEAFTLPEIATTTTTIEETTTTTMTTTTQAGFVRRHWSRFSSWGR